MVLKEDIADQRSPDNTSTTDPTELTDKAIAKAIVLMTQYIDGKIAVIDERTLGQESAMMLRLEGANKVPERIDAAVGRLEDVMMEKFRGVDQRFTERDIRSERESRDNKLAVDAAFAAQEKQAAAQNRSNAEAIDKSEKATTETIKTNLELTRSKTDDLTKNLDEVKIAVSRIESMKVGATENRTGIYAAIAIVGTILSILIIAVNFISQSGG